MDILISALFRTSRGGRSHGHYRIQRCHSRYVTRSRFRQWYTYLAPWWTSWQICITNAAQCQTGMTLSLSSYWNRLTIYVFAMYDGLDSDIMTIVIQCSRHPVFGYLPCSRNVELNPSFRKGWLGFSLPSWIFLEITMVWYW